MGQRCQYCVLLSSQGGTTYSSIPFLFALLYLSCASRNDRGGQFSPDFKSYENKKRRVVECLLQLINTFIKVAEYKVNSQKSVAFLYTNGQWAEKSGKQHLLQSSQIM